MASLTRQSTKHSNSPIPSGIGRGLMLAGLTLLAAGSSPAPDLKLPSELKLPSIYGVFKRNGNELEETKQAPTGPGGMCVLPSGEYVISCHQFFNHQYRVMMLDKKNNWVPFPNAEMNTPGSGYPVVLDSVLGVTCDSRGIVWMLDNGRRSETPPKLVAWDTKRNQLHQIIVINPQALTPRSFLKNLVLDPQAPLLYITDPADGVSSAIVVVDTETNRARRVLEEQSSTRMDPTLALELDGKSVEVRRPDGHLATPLTGVSPIAIDRRGDWLYFGPRNGSSLFKIETKYLRRLDIAPLALESKVVGVSPKPICDSMTLDSRGRIYFGDISRGSIDYVTEDEDFLNLRLLLVDPRISWPGGLLIGPDGNLHFFSNQLHRTPFFNSGKDVSSPPFSIFKARPLPSNRFGF